MKKIFTFALPILILLGCAATLNNSPSRIGPPTISNFQILDQVRAGERFRACFDFLDEDGNLEILEITWLWDGRSETQSLPIKNVDGKTEGCYFFRPMVESGNSGKNFTLSIRVIDTKRNKSNILTRSFRVN